MNTYTITPAAMIALATEAEARNQGYASRDEFVAAIREHGLPIVPGPLAPASSEPLHDGSRDCECGDCTAEREWEDGYLDDLGL